MNILQPWQLLLVALAGWINQQQQGVIEYLQEENRVLRSKIKGRGVCAPAATPCTAGKAIWPY